MKKIHEVNMWGRHLGSFGVVRRTREEGKGIWRRVALPRYDLDPL